jgi:hypothetical protein
MIGGLVVAGLALVALGLGLGFLRRRGGTR